MSDRFLENQIYSVQKVIVLTSMLREQGIATADALADSGIAAETLDDENAKISPRQVEAFYTNVVKLTGDPAIGLYAGQRIHVSNYGLFGYALLSSPTLRKAIDFALSYHALAAPTTRMAYRVKEDVGVVVTVEHMLDAESLLPFNMELQFSLTLSLLKDILPTFSYTEIRTSYPAPAYRAAYEQVLGCPVVFDCRANEFRFAATLLDKDLVLGNPLTAKMCVKLCQRMLAELNSQNSENQNRENLADTVRYILLETPGRFPDINSVARTLNMTPRTLRRKLQALGTSYQEIFTDVRRRLAIEYLRNTGFSTEDIAERVGFSDAANFRHAFKKWTGKTPRLYRTP
jgi:AraC-like DNA-binding protein